MRMAREGLGTRLKVSVVWDPGNKMTFVGAWPAAQTHYVSVRGLYAVPKVLEGKELLL